VKMDINAFVFGLFVEVVAPQVLRTQQMEPILVLNIA
jgi:hypothetical protein